MTQPASKRLVTEEGLSTPGHVAADWLFATFGGLLDVASVATIDGALTRGKHNPVDATSGNRTMTIANAAAKGQLAIVEKADSSANTVTVTGNFRGSSGSVVLSWQRESIVLVAAADGTWWPIAGHKTKASLDAAFSALGGDVVTRTTSGALTVGKTNAVDATSGALAVTLANAPTKGLLTPVYKADGSANAVTITLKLRGSGSTSTLTLSTLNEGRLLQSRADGTYDILSDHRTQTAMDAAYAAKPDNAARAVGQGEIVLEARSYGSLQAACDAAAARASGAQVNGVTVLLPLGTTNLPSTLNIKQQGLIIQGKGPGSILKWTGAAGSPMIDVQDSSRTLFADMTILGDATNPPLAGIYSEAPTLATTGTNEYCIIQRVSFGRRFTTDTVGGAPMQYGFLVGGATDGNNDQFVVEDTQFHDCSVAGIAILNTQSIWGDLRDVAFNQCAIGLKTNANVETRNLQFNRCGIDIQQTQGRVNVTGFYSEHTGLLWSQSTTSALFIRGGKAIVGVGSDLTDSTRWASSGVSGGNQLSIRDFFVSRSAGSSKLFISGSSSNTVASHVFIRSSNLPDGDSDLGYIIDGYAAGTPLHVDIQQGTYWRRQVVQSLASASSFAPLNSYAVLGPWWQDNVATSQTNAVLSDGQPTHAGVVMVRAGFLTGLVAKLNIARTAGTITVQASKNGSAIGLTAVLDGTNTAIRAVTMPLGSYPFAAGDTIGVRITSSSDWAPITSDLTAAVEITV